MIRALRVAIATACFAVLAAAPAYAQTLGLSVVKVAPKDGGGEPSIAAGPEGNLYVSYPSDSGMSFYRSSNLAAAWDKAGIADPGSGDTSVNVDSTGAVYQTNLAGDEDAVPLQAD